MIIAIRIYQKALAAVARGESFTKASKDYSMLGSNTASPQRWKCSETRSLKNHTEQQLRDHNLANISNGALDAWTVCERRRPAASCIRNRRDLGSEASIEPHHKVLNQSLDEGII